MYISSYSESDFTVLDVSDFHRRCFLKLKLLKWLTLTVHVTRLYVHVPKLCVLTTVRCLLSSLFVLLSTCVVYGQDLRIIKPSQEFKLQKDIHSFDFSSEKLEEIIYSKSTQLSLEVELPNRPISKLNLVRTKTFDNTIFLDADGNRVVFEPLIYTGHIENTKSLVSLTFTSEGVIGIVSVEGKNWNLDIRLDSKKQLVFTDDIVPAGFTGNCGFKDFGEDFIVNPLSSNDLSSKPSAKDKSAALSVVDVYLEADYETFLDFNSDTTAALNHVTSLMATVNMLFNGAEIDLNFPEIKLWTSTDPYDTSGANSSGEVLDRFKCALDGNYNGRLAHLLTTMNGFGGIAYRKSSCPYNRPLYGFTGIATNFNPDLNVYSYSVHFIAHELGHNLSSHHTHACQWNSDNTQIDDCGNRRSTSNNSDSNCNGIIDDQEEAEGSDCFDIDNPILPTKGTIMSYCHAVSGIGVDLALGFHPQVANRMKEYVDNCLGTIVTQNCPIVDTTEILISYPTPNSMQFTCTRTADVDSYAWKYKADISCISSNTITTTVPVLLVDNPYGNTPYEVECAIKCASIQTYSDWSCPKIAQSPSCFPVQTLSGIVDNEETYTQASLTIHSEQQIINGSDVSYIFGKEANLNQGFVVDKGSTFIALYRSCD